MTQQSFGTDQEALIRDIAKDVYESLGSGHNEKVYDDAYQFSIAWEESNTTRNPRGQPIAEEGLFVPCEN